MFRFNTLGKCKLVECIYCGANYIIKSVKEIPCGNNSKWIQIVYSVESENTVQYNKEDNLYHCKKCGGVFSFQEATTQKPKVEDKLKEYFK